jgi:hypothetical protein
MRKVFLIESDSVPNSKGTRANHARNSKFHFGKEKQRSKALRRERHNSLK